MRVWFNFAFFTNYFHEPYWHSCMEHQFVYWYLFFVEPDGNSSTRGGRVLKLWSTHTCGAQLSTGFPDPGWVCLWWIEARETLCTIGHSDAVPGVMEHSVHLLLSRCWKSCMGVVTNHAVGTNAWEQLWFKSCGTFLRVVFFPFFSTGWQHQI